MSRYLLFSFVACLVLTTVLPLTAKPAEDGAFLVDSATSVSQLIDQVEGNRLVALRYAKHFGTDPSSVLAFFRSQLTVTELTQDITVTEYYLDESRSITSRSVDLKAGLKVFANKAGAPVLRLGTGNPLCEALSSAAVIRNNSVPLTTTKPTEEDVVTQVLSTTPTEFTGATSSNEAARSASLESGTLVAANIPAPTPPVAGRSSSGSAFSGWLIPAGVIGAAAAFAGGGGGTSDVIVNNPTDKNQLIPEPAGLITLAAGLTGLAGLVYRRQKSR